MSRQTSVCGVAVLLAMLLPWCLPLSPQVADATGPGLVQELRLLALQPVFVEDFGAEAVPGLPAGWAQTNVAGISGSWGITTEITHPAYYDVPHSPPNSAFFNSASAPPDDRTRLYSTAGSDLSRAIGAFVFFWMYHDDYYQSNSDYVEVQFSVNGGPWTSVDQTEGGVAYRYSRTIGWYCHSATLPSGAFGAGATDVRIGFLSTSKHGLNMYVDDVQLLAEWPEPTPVGTLTATATTTGTSTSTVTPTGTPTSTFTPTGTSTATVTPTGTSTSTVTPTGTPTATVSTTVTPLSTSTNTPTPTVTAIQMITPTPSATPTPTAMRASHTAYLPEVLKPGSQGVSILDVPASAWASVWSR